MARTRQTRTRDNRGRPAPQLKLRRGAYYSEAEKIAAATIMLELGGITIEAINAVRTKLNSNVSAQTMAKWLAAYRDKVLATKADLIKQPEPVDTAAIVQETQANLVNDLMAIQGLITNHIMQDDIIKDASLRDSMVSLGISSDKIERWLGMSAEARDRWNKLQAMCLPAGLDPIKMMDDMLLALQQHIESRQLPPGDEPADR